jgi:hypothetical protein
MNDNELRDKRSKLKRREILNIMNIIWKDIYFNIKLVDILRDRYSDDGYLVRRLIEMEEKMYAIENLENEISKSYAGGDSDE